MISQKMQEALNDQMKWEFYSEFLYLAMAGYFKARSLDGFANWMTIQTQEEHAHAMMFFAYIADAGGRPDVRAFDQMENEYDSVTDVFRKTVEHEKLVTMRINDLMDLAVEEKDHATAQFLAWFVKEQVEEVASPQKILDQLELVKEDGNALMMLDRELSQRVFNPPSVAT
ncbi:MAG: ferritin [Actinobacteria bacterium]|jgi:ferritin|nr:MAG: ferritin [Actinomycetota bacterium]